MKRAVELTDPRALRGLAHPVRVKLLGLLRLEGPMTATDAGRRLGESSGSASYHLRQLERFGLVEEAEGGVGRRRPWRATSLYTSWPNVADSPELAEAADAFERFVVAGYMERLEKWLERRRGEPEDWQEAAAFGDSLVYLTVDELAGIRDALQALVDPYLDRIGHPERHPPGTRPVKFLHIAFPEDRS